ncbi:N-acetylmuramoyl-L-alanine amidase [Bacillus sp. FSL M8-0063]|uniref:N-acetylmuramoyl-L-alanine amidase n=1 Tax=Bacillus sp. FSL M8-0063 TaxID=2921566 RepID=UPI0030F61911
MTNVEVVIDAGHGAHDSGAVGNGLLEKERALKLSHMLNEELRASGVSTYMTRTTDVFVTLSGRAKMANDRGAKVFISNHLNSAENPSALGYETFVLNRNDKNTNHLQDLIHAEGMKVLAPLGFRDRGIRTSNLAVLRETHMPAVLTENGFISNASDMAHIRKDEVLRKLAQAYATAICTYLGKPYKGSGSTGGSTQPPTTGGGSNGIGIITISGEGLRIRTGAGTNYPVKRPIEKGDYIVWATKDGWACVGGDEWVYADPSYTTLKLNGQPPTQKPVTGVAYILGTNVNLRKAPNVNGEFIRKLNKPENYKVWGKEGDWLNLGGDQWVKYDPSYIRFVQD